MNLGQVFRNIVRPLSTTHKRFLPTLLQSCRHEGIISPSLVTSSSSSSRSQPLYLSPLGAFFSTSASSGAVFNSLTDARFPNRRSGMKSRRKRASLKPPGPYAWIQYVPGEPIPRNRPNEGSVKGRNRIKRIKQRKAFILSQEKKRKAQYAAFREKRDMERVERKMAAVAREKAWAERLVELQWLEAEKQQQKSAMAP